MPVTSCSDSPQLVRRTSTHLHSAWRAASQNGVWPERRAGLSSPWRARACKQGDLQRRARGLPRRRAARQQTLHLNNASKQTPGCS
eukprot:6207875-Pleurochrysis_carterae.AAC.1